MPLPSSRCYSRDTEGQGLSELSKSQGQAMVAPVFEQSSLQKPHSLPLPETWLLGNARRTGLGISPQVIRNMLRVSIPHIFGEGLQPVQELQTQMPAGVKK